MQDFISRRSLLIRRLNARSTVFEFHHHKLDPAVRFRRKSAAKQAK
jgi:hypothetical protein